MDGDGYQLGPEEVKPKKYFPRYMIIREVGDKEMCAAVNWLTEQGYEPAGGVQAYNVSVPRQIVGPGRVAPQALGFVQALWLPPGKPLVEVPDISEPEGPAS